MIGFQPRTHRPGTLSAEDVGAEVRLYGWVDAVHDHGGVRFLRLRDHTGLVQCVVSPADSPEAHQASGEVRREWVLGVSGAVAARPEGTAEADLASGAVEVRVTGLEVLSRARPPALDVGADELGEDARLRHRILDLRRPAMQRRLRFRADMIAGFRRHLDAHGFAECETPVLTRATPEGAKDFLVPSRRAPGRGYALPQSPQLFKQLLMIGGWDRYYQVCRCFRDEELRADRQPEFTQLDLEVAFTPVDELHALVEGLFADLAARHPDLGLPAPPFPRLTFAEAMLRHGSENPDLRVPWQIEAHDDLLDHPGLSKLVGGAAQGATLRVLKVPGGRALPRKVLDGLSAHARRHGAAGVLWMRRGEGEGWTCPAKGWLGAEALDAVAGACPPGPDDALVFAAGDPAQVAPALGDSLRELAGRLEAHQPGHQLCWVVDFPWLEHSHEEGRWVARHHPFTKPRLEDLDAGVPVGEVRAQAYDLVMDGLEVGGGSVRIADVETQRRMFDLLGIAEDEARERFGFLLEALELGAPPHAGMALGVDRLAARLTGAPSIRDVIAFPKTADGSCRLTGAPGHLETEALVDLGLRRLSPSGAGSS